MGVIWFALLGAQTKMERWGRVRCAYLLISVLPLKVSQRTVFHAGI